MSKQNCDVVVTLISLVRAKLTKTFINDGYGKEEPLSSLFHPRPSGSRHEGSAQRLVIAYPCFTPSSVNTFLYTFLAMAPSAGCREMTSSLVQHLVPRGKAHYPYEMAAHLALRFKMRAALLKAFLCETQRLSSENTHSSPGHSGWLLCSRGRPPAVPWRLSEETQVAVWRYVSCQTHIATESLFWLCLTPARQLELCKCFALRRAKIETRRKLQYIVPEFEPGPRTTYIIVHGSARVGIRMQDSLDDRDEGVKYARNAVDSAMFDEPRINVRQPNNDDEEDVRMPSHVFGSIWVPDDVKQAAVRARNQAKTLYSFMLREKERAVRHGVFDSPKQTDSCSRNSTSAEADRNLPYEPDEVSSKRPGTAEFIVDWNLEVTSEHREMVAEVFQKSDGFDRNRLLSYAEIQACLTDPKFADFKGYLLRWFHLFDVNCDGELEIFEVEKAAANFTARFRPKTPPKLPLDDEPVDTSGPYEFGSDEDDDAQCCNEESALPADWTWESATSGSPAFSVDTEYLTLEASEAEAREIWQRAMCPTELNGVVGRLNVSEVLALRSRGLGFLCAHARVTELQQGQSLCEEGEVPSEVFLILDGSVSISRLHELEEEDDHSIRAAKEAGLFFDTDGFGTLPGPILINDAAHLFRSPVASLLRVHTATVCRAIVVDASRFRRLVHTHDAERQALIVNAKLRSIWLCEQSRFARDERRRGRMECGDSFKLPLSPHYTQRGRFWKLWSAGAVLAEPSKRIRWLNRVKDWPVQTAFNGAPASFFAGSVLTQAEIEFAKQAALRLPRSRNCEALTETKRRARVSVSVVTTGSMGSFVSPGLFDRKPVQPSPDSIDAPIEVVLPTPEDLRLARDVPLLQPFPTATRARHLHACRLPIGLEKVEPFERLRTSRPTDPIHRRTMAALCVSRERCNTAPSKLRDAFHEIGRYRALLHYLNEKVPNDDESLPAETFPLTRDRSCRRNRFGLAAQEVSRHPPRVLDSDHDSRLQAGLPPLAGADLAVGDRRRIHASVEAAILGMSHEDNEHYVAALGDAVEPGTGYCYYENEFRIPDNDVSNEPSFASTGNRTSTMDRLRYMRTTKRAASCRRQNYAKMSNTIAAESPSELSFA